jgi:hypothetical protein
MEGGITKTDADPCVRKCNAYAVFFLPKKKVGCVTRKSRGLFGRSPFGAFRGFLVGIYTMYDVAVDVGEKVIHGVCWFFAVQNLVRIRIIRWCLCVNK